MFWRIFFKLSSTYLTLTYIYTKIKIYIPAIKFTLGVAAFETTAVSVGGGIGLPSFVCKL